MLSLYTLSVFPSAQNNFSYFSPVSAQTVRIHMESRVPAVIADMSSTCIYAAPFTDDPGPYLNCVTTDKTS